MSLWQVLQCCVMLPWLSAGPSNRHFFILKKKGTNTKTKPKTTNNNNNNKTKQNKKTYNALGRLSARPMYVYMYVACLTSQQQASVSQGRSCSDKFTCCHTEIEVAEPTFYFSFILLAGTLNRRRRKGGGGGGGGVPGENPEDPQSQYTDTGPTSPSADPITPGAWQGSHWSVNFWVTGMTRPRRRDSNPGSSALDADGLPLCQRGGQQGQTTICIIDFFKLTPVCNRNIEGHDWKSSLHFVVHVSVILDLQNRCMSLWDRYLWKTFKYFDVVYTVFFKNMQCSRVTLRQAF